jgi:hypothetical protein
MTKSVSDTVQQFEAAYEFVGVAVGNLVDTNALYIVGPDACDAIEVSLRRIWEETDRGLAAVARHRAVRARQAVDALTKCAADFGEIAARLEAESGANRLEPEPELCPIYQLGVEDPK